MKNNEDFVLREIYNKYILMPIRANEVSNDPIVLSDVAVEIWRSVGQCENVICLEQLILEKYDLHKDSAEFIAVRSFIGKMLDMGLIIN